jgi:hypothetical protein
MLARFDNDVTGVLESSKLATGRGEGHRGQDTVEVNGTHGSIVYSTQKPLELWIGHRGDADLRKIDVPREFQVWPGSPRDPSIGDPLATFRYDQGFEFHRRDHERPPLPPQLPRGRDGASGHGRGDPIERATRVGGRAHDGVTNMADIAVVTGAGSGVGRAVRDRAGEARLRRRAGRAARGAATRDDHGRAGKRAARRGSPATSATPTTSREWPVAFARSSATRRCS